MIMSTPLPLLVVVVDHRQPDVAVGRGGAVSGEVLGGGDDGLLIAGHLLARHDRGKRGVGREGPLAEHGVARAEVDVRDRREVVVDAHCAQLPAGDLGCSPRVVRRPGGPEGAGRRQQRDGWPDPDDRTVLLVGRDQQRHRGARGQGGPLQPVGQLGDLSG
jgi:hypothetical protein